MDADGEIMNISITTKDPQESALLVAAGPAGAMPFVLAVQYKVPVAAIARAILYSTLGSLVTVTVASQYA